MHVHQRHILPKTSTVHGFFCCVELKKGQKAETNMPFTGLLKDIYQPLSQLSTFQDFPGPRTPTTCPADSGLSPQNSSLLSH